MKIGLDEIELINKLKDNQTYKFICVYHFVTYKNRNYIIKVEMNNDLTSKVSKIMNFSYVIGSNDDAKSLEILIDKKFCNYEGRDTICDMIEKIGAPLHKEIEEGSQLIVCSLFDFKICDVYKY